MNIVSWIQKANSFIRSSKIVNTEDIKAHHTSLGWELRLQDKRVTVEETNQNGSGSESCVPAIVTGKDGSLYTIDIYEDGYDAPATLTGQYCKILMLNYAQTLPSGTQVIVLKTSISSTNGGTV